MNERREKCRTGNVCSSLVEEMVYSAEVFNRGCFPATIVILTEAAAAVAFSATSS